MAGPTLSTMSGAIYAAYARSLAWLALLAAIAVGVSLVVDVVIVDFVRGNTGRTQENAIITMLVMPPLLGLLVIVWVLLIYALPQCFQAAVSAALVRRSGDQAQAGVLLVLPITAVITWYCYDYLLPSYFNADWQYGLTTARYMATLAFQAPATLFSVAYAAAGSKRAFQKRIVFLAFVAAIIVGGVEGYRMAYRVIEEPSLSAY